MKNVAFGALIVGLLVACGGSSSSPKKIMVHDGATVDSPPVLICNPATQTGCAAGQKCTWVTDATSPMPLGHIDCVMDGTVALGGTCMEGPAGSTTGFDNCKAGGYCISNGTNGVCEPICDPSQGLAACSANHACGLYSDTFLVNGTITFGVCEQTCDPLADNNFTKSTKTGTTCNATQGCYGFPDFGAQPPSYYTCSRSFLTTASQGVECNNTTTCTTIGMNQICCAASDGTPYLNGCSQGFMPFYFESETVMTRVCTSFCAPAECYNGSCGTANANIIGASPHRCNSGTTGDSAGTFDNTSVTITGPTAGVYDGGHSCHYMWDYEWDEMTTPVSMTFVRSTTSDTLGFCDNHHIFHYSSQLGSMVFDVPIPPCAAFPAANKGFGDGMMHPPATGTTCPGNPAPATCCMFNNGCLGAADFGCVSSATAGLPFEGKYTGPAPKGYNPLYTDMPRPRAPFSAAKHR